MITWMQKHKKWLVVTIWISTIAFVGAGGIWALGGGVSFGGDYVAQAGSEKISNSEFKREYSIAYNQMLEQYGGDFDEASAKALGLPQQILEMMVFNAQVRAFAKDLGLRVSDEEVVNFLRSAEFFQTDGEFDKEKYKAILAQNYMRVDDYERRVRDSLLVDKVTASFNTGNLAPSALESMSIALPMNIENSIEVKILKPQAVQASDDEVREFWEKNKHLYKTNELYEVEILKFAAQDESIELQDALENFENWKKLYGDEPNFPADYDEFVATWLKAEEWRESEFNLEIKMPKALKSARRAYSAFQNGENIGEKISFCIGDDAQCVAPEFDQFVISDSEKFANALDFEQALGALEVGQVLKPWEQENGYALVKVLSHKKPESKSFEDAQELAKADLLSRKKTEDLENRAKELSADFNSKNFGKLDSENIGAWSFQKFMTQQFNNGADLKSKNLDLGDLYGIIDSIGQSNFDKATKTGYVIRDDKAIVYKIAKQKIGDASSSVEQIFAVTRIAGELKRNIILDAWQDYLNTKYQPKLLKSIN